MAWAIRAGATRASNLAGGGASSFNLGNLGANTVTGDRIIAAIDLSLVASQPNVTGFSATGGGGIEWSRDFILQISHNGYFEDLEIWSGVCQADGAVTAITATTTVLTAGSSGLSWAITAFSGLAIGFGLGVDQNGVQDLVSGGFADTTGNTTCDSHVTLIGTNKPNQLVIGATADAGGNVTLTQGTGFTLAVKTDVNVNGECLLEYKDSGAIGFPQQATATASGAIYDMTAVAVYRLLAGNTQPAFKRPYPFTPGLAR